MIRDAILALVVAMAVGAPIVAEDVDPAAELAQLRERVAQLEQRVAELEAAVKNSAAADAGREAIRAKVRERMARDGEKYTAEQLREAENLYQVANKNWRSPEARATLKVMIEKYPDINRTGCAVLYLGQMSEGQERLEYLTRALEKHADCFYGDGTQVGPQAMLYLGFYYREAGDAAKASEYFDRLRTEHPDAIGHRGQKLVEQIPKE